MGLITVFKGLFSDTEEAILNNEKVQEIELRQGMRDMDEAVVDANKEKTKILAAKNTSAKKVEKLEKKVAEYNQAGKKLFAASQSQEGDAKASTLAKLDVLSDQVSTLDTELANAKNLLAIQSTQYLGIKKNVAAMERKVKEAKNQKIMLDGQKAVHKARANTIDVKGVDSKMSRAMEIMQKSQDRLDNSESLVDAAEQIHDETHVDVASILAETNEKSAAERWG